MRGYADVQILINERVNILKELNTTKVVNNQ